jgi:hypothetical protein
MKDPGGSGMVEADIVINGVALSFGESMSVRVALGSFLPMSFEVTTGIVHGAKA